MSSQSESPGEHETVTDPAADRFTRRSYTLRRSKEWQNWALSAVAVIFAVVAIVVLAA